MLEAVQQGQAWLSQLKQERADQLPAYEQHLESISSTIKQYAETLAALHAESTLAAQEIQVLAQRLGILNRFAETGQLPEEADTLTDAIIRLRTIPLSTPGPEGTGYLADDTAREIIGKVYDMWLNKKYGERTLKTLAAVVWTESVNHAGSLRDNYTRSVHRAVEKFILEARTRIKDATLRGIIDAVNRRDIQMPPEDPVNEISLLTFNNRFSINPLKGFAYTPGDLWGADGEKIIERGADERILLEERDHFVSYIWGAPWNIKSYFSPLHLESRAQEMMTGEITRALVQQIPVGIKNMEQTVEKIKENISGNEARLAAVTADKARVEATIAQLNAQCSDLENRSHTLEAIVNGLW